MKRYAEYKDSGIPWLGAVPSGWSINRGKDILTLLERPVKDDDEVITCFRDGEVTLRKNRREEGFTVSMKEVGYQGIEPGDLVVHGMDGFAGSIGVSDSRGKATPVLNVMDSTQNKRYLMYYLRMAAYRDVFMSLSTGIRVRSCDLRWNKLSVFPFLIPSKEEQNTIAEYIDDKLAQIDFLINEAKASIEEYKAWKASIIYEAVTKGLDKDVEMKDSGIDVIGYIPKHWDYIPLKMAFDYSQGSAVRVGPFGSALSGSDIIEEGVWVYNQRTILDNNFETNNTFVSPQKAKELNSFAVREGDVLITTRGSIGKIAIVPDGAPQGVLHPCIIRFRTNKKIINDELLKILFNESDLMLEQMRRRSNSTTIDVLYSYSLKELRIPLIPMNEQREITKYLADKVQQIKLLIHEKESLIADLETYKKSLIFETVTGKRKVV